MFYVKGRGKIGVTEKLNRIIGQYCYDVSQREVLRRERLRRCMLCDYSNEMSKVLLHTQYTGTPGSFLYSITTLSDYLQQTQFICKTPFKGIIWEKTCQEWTTEIYFSDKPPESNKTVKEV